MIFILIYVLIGVGVINKTKELILTQLENIADEEQREALLNNRILVLTILVFLWPIVLINLTRYL